MQPGERFVHPLKKHLVQLNKNLYLSRSDPRYYEKVIRFLDPSSPEAHFRVAQKLDREGHRSKALHHYRESMKRYPSEYYFLAASAIRKLEASQSAALSAELLEETETRLPFKPLAVALVLLILFNAVLLLLMLNSASVSRTVSALKFWGVGKEVAYEQIELPYAMYFAGAADPKEVEKQLFDRTIELGKANPNKSIVLYGMTAEGGPADGQAYPLTDLKRSKQAFVEARYDAAHDRTVSIRFIDPLPVKENKQLNRVTAAGANYVRTALLAYKQDHGTLPPEPASLRADYPSNYISFIPLEPSSGSSRVATAFDGGGGWVYDRGAEAAEALFYPNVSGSNDGALPSMSVPYEPFRIIVGKNDHALRLVSGETVLLEETVGLGEKGLTPSGRFTVTERVREPKGSSPGVYGSAALGLGAIAIHGTNQEESVGRNMSKGCIRLNDAEVARLYPLVPRGTVVDIGDALPLSRAGGSTVRANPNAPTTATVVNLKDVVDLQQFIPSNVSYADENALGFVFHWLN